MFESKNLESCSRNVDSCSRAGRAARTMSSVAAAHELTRGVGDLLAPAASGKVKLDLIYRELSKRLPDISRRRVRALFFGEASRVDYEEMRALKELRAEEEARRARLKLAATANMLAAHLAAEGAPLDSHQISALCRIAGTLGVSGVAE